MNDPMLPLPGLSPVSGKSVVAKFDGGLLSSNGGVLALREVEKRLRGMSVPAVAAVQHGAGEHLGRERPIRSRTPWPTSFAFAC